LAPITVRRLLAESTREVPSTDTPSATRAKTLLSSVGAALSVTTTPVPAVLGEVNVTDVPVPDAVAAAESVIVAVAGLIAVIVVPAAMPVPVTFMPVCR